MNQLPSGDNLHALREHIASESLGLIYLDPPFNSNRESDPLCQSPEGRVS
ncbi:hypothetical protein BH20VER1_BH20VER1_26190 [soil metagenome]